MQFWKVITGENQVFHQTLNLAVFWEIKYISLQWLKNLFLQSAIYIPANWHQLRSTEMLKQSYFHQCWST